MALFQFLLPSKLPQPGLSDMFITFRTFSVNKTSLGPFILRQRNEVKRKQLNDRRSCFLLSTRETWICLYQRHVLFIKETNSNLKVSN